MIEQRVVLQMTQPTSGGAVTAVANCVETSRPLQWWPNLPFFGQPDHADPVDDWCCSS